MIPELGQFALIIALCIALVQGVLPIAGAAFAASLLIMGLVTLLQELFSGRAMRPADRSLRVPIDEVAMPEGQRDEVETAASADEAILLMPVDVAMPEPRRAWLSAVPSGVRRSGAPS